jgi:hypothetical protein
VSFFTVLPLIGKPSEYKCYLFRGIGVIKPSGVSQSSSASGRRLDVRLRRDSSLVGFFTHHLLSCRLELAAPTARENTTSWRR